MNRLTFAERPAAGETAGLLVLHHGRGTDERDLLPLADVLDPARHLHVVAPRGPLAITGWPGRHWYVARRVGYPDRATFEQAYHQLAVLHDQLWDQYEIEPSRTVLGGFSMGAVMTYALGFGDDRPSVAGILALSGFIPTVEDWQPDLDTHGVTPVFIAHGRHDPVIDVSFARTARELLEEHGVDVEYHESDAGHHLDPGVVEAAKEWIERSLATAGRQ